MRVRQQQQRGVALITAMLVVAMVTVAAASMANRLNFDIRRSANLFQIDQAYLYTLGIEQWTGQIMARDRRENKYDTLDEPWAQVPPPIPVEGGQLSGRIVDRQGLFNLNNLVSGGEPEELVLEQFKRLLRALMLSEDIATAVVDWLDSDIDPHFPGGAEDSTYLSREQPYRTANGIMGDLSELRLIEGIDDEVYTALEPFVTVLPDETKLNVNTAPKEVLMSLSDEITAEVADKLIEERSEAEGFETVEKFLQTPAMSGIALVEEDLSVASEYFLVASRVEFGRITLDYLSLMKRDDKGATKIVKRVQGILHDTTENPDQAGS